MSRRSPPSTCAPGRHLRAPVLGGTGPQQPREPAAPVRAGAPGQRLGFRDVEILDADLGASAADRGQAARGLRAAAGGRGARRGRPHPQSRAVAAAAHRQGLLPAGGALPAVRHARRRRAHHLRREPHGRPVGARHQGDDERRRAQSVLRMRLLEGKENKARRGALYPRLPPGYVWDAHRQVVKDPNLRVQEAMHLVFAKFRETWSIRQTFKWFRDNDVDLPVTPGARRHARRCLPAAAADLHRRRAAQPVLRRGVRLGAAAGGGRVARRAAAQTADQRRYPLSRRGSSCPTTTRGTLTGRRSRSTNG